MQAHDNGVHRLTKPDTASTMSEDAARRRGGARHQPAGSAHCIYVGALWQGEGAGSAHTPAGDKRTAYEMSGTGGDGGGVRGRETHDANDT